jgi:hypothetical protein
VPEAEHHLHAQALSLTILPDVSLFRADQVGECLSGRAEGQATAGPRPASQGIIRER